MTTLILILAVIAVIALLERNHRRNLRLGAPQPMIDRQFEHRAWW